MRISVELSPEDAEAHKNLGVALESLAFLSEAEAAYRKAVELKPDYAEALSYLGALLINKGDLDGAETACKRAITANPGYAQAYNNIGMVYNDLGRLSEAVDAYNKALSIKPDLAECYRNLSLLKKYKPGDPQIETLRKLYASPSLKDADRIHVCFALAKALEDIGETDESFSFYAEGNRLRKKELNYNINKDYNIFGIIKSVFKELPAVPVVPLGSVQPVLIVGMPRSGTSLVEQILASHSMVFGAGELETLNLLAQKNIFDKLPSPDMKEALVNIAKGFIEEMDSISEGRKFVTDKMPTDFRWLGFVLAAQPDVKVIHTVRDKMAVCWSIYRQYFPAKGLGFPYDLADLAEFYKLYEDLMGFWKGLFPNRIYDLSYEALTENPEEETRKLLNYCGLAWEDACLEFEKNKRAVRTASAAQVRQKIYKGSSEAWKRFEKHLVPLMEGIGYMSGSAAV